MLGKHRRGWKETVPCSKVLDANMTIGPSDLLAQRLAHRLLFTKVAGVACCLQSWTTLAEDSDGNACLILGSEPNVSTGWVDTNACTGAHHRHRHHKVTAPMHRLTAHLQISHVGLQRATTSAESTIHVAALFSTS